MSQLSPPEQRSRPCSLQTLMYTYYDKLSVLRILNTAQVVLVLSSLAPLPCDLASTVSTGTGACPALLMTLLLTSLFIFIS